MTTTSRPRLGDELERDAGPTPTSAIRASRATRPARRGLSLLGAAVTLPWTFLYGITGVWAVALAARAAGQGLKQLDAGYTRFVTPPQLALRRARCC